MISLLAIHDNFRKMVVVANGIVSGINEDGVYIQTLLDFLLDANSVQ